MALTYAQQTRTARISGMKGEYVSSTAVTDAGDLPDTFLFVYSVVDPLDPKQDVLLRVATTADLVLTTTSRVAAVTAQDFVYRTAVAEISYEDINDAINASKSIAEQLNDLVTEYQTYLTELVTNPVETFAFPQATLGLLGALVTDYTASAAAVAAQQTLITNTTATCLEEETQLATLQADVTAQAALVTALTTAKSSYATTVSSLNDILNVHTSVSTLVGSTLSTWATERSGVAGGPQAAMDVYLLSPTGSLYTAYNASLVPSLATTSAARDAANSALAALSAQISTESATLSLKRAAQDAKQTDVTACSAKKTQQQGVLTTLTRQTAALLTQIRALCPGYVP